VKQERRQSIRTPVDFFVQARRTDLSALLPAIDVSTTGLYLLTGDDHGAVDAENELELEFTLPTGHVVEAMARIAYVDDRMGRRGLALTFTDLGPRDLDALSRFVAVSETARRRLA
jgi:hypothetical protein